MWKEMRSSYLTSSAVMILLGVILFLFPDTSVKLVCRVIGLVILAYGLIKLIEVIRHREILSMFGLQAALGLVPAFIGMWMLVAPQVFASILPVIVGVFLSVIGAVELKSALSMKKAAFDSWWMTMTLAVVTLLLAVFVLWNPFATLAATVMMIGAVLVVAGISNLIQLAGFNRKMKALGKKLEERGQEWNSWFWF